MMGRFSQFVYDFIRRHSFLYSVGRILRGHHVVLLDYPVRAQPRYGWGKPPHLGLYELIDRGREYFMRIPVGVFWVGGWEAWRVFLGEDEVMLVLSALGERLSRFMVIIIVM
jgi:hypothetical protein